MSDYVQLPKLPEGWVWHIAPRYGNQLQAELVDSTRLGKMMCQKRNSAEFPVGSTRYEEMLRNGVHVASVEASTVRQLIRRAKPLAERVWLVERTRQEYARTGEAS